MTSPAGSHPTSDERTAWIALASVPGVGEEIFGALLSVFGSARGALAAAQDGGLDSWISERRRIDGRPPLNSRTRETLRTAAANPSGALDDMASRGLWTLTPLDSDFPARLHDLDPPPAMINGLGDPDALRASRCVAVVGTRRPTPAGRALTTRVATRLVEAGAVVVSGLAVGIDGAAHAGTVAQRGITVAVIGAGHDSPGPRAHTRLREQIVESGGALISEYHPATFARHGTYPRRNRIIAALGDATVVVEAPARSGARITAALALELSRLVLVAPGRVGDWATAGSLALLRETPARPLVGLDEMIEDLGYLDSPPARAAQDGQRSDQGTAAKATSNSIESLLGMLGPVEQRIARQLLNGPAGLDALVDHTQLAPAVVSGAVTLLLLRGWAQSVGPAYIAAGALAR